jgi:hypothetical protein
MTRPYDFRALRRIAVAVGPCRDRRDMLEHICRAAQDYLLTDPGAPAKDRDRLLALAGAAERASRLYGKLDHCGEIRLVWTALERGFELHQGYLENLAEVAKAAAAATPVRSGPQDERLSNFIHALAAYVEHFAGWRGVYTYSDIEDSYGGKFFNVVKACLVPLGTEDAGKSDAALAQAIRRVVCKDESLA